ncbi:hypothetical protein ACFFF7_01285 [Novosphingobium aquiterrae]|uniref:Fe-S oxidoreductase n=1 Tax=Novosphingobium aquiterrae TaxID=624388 RepID=A0ABV6PG57_9SPHN
MKQMLFLGMAATALMTLPAQAQTMDPAMPMPSATPPIQVQANPASAEAPSATPPNPTTAADPVPPAVPADPSYQAGAYKGALTAPPAEALNKVYPLCTKTLRDSCRNPGGK